MAPSDNRHTQLDMLALAGPKPLSPPSQSVGLQGSRNGRTLQSDAPNKKTARSPGQDALNVLPETGKARSRLDRSATTGSLRLRAAWESPWKKYEKVYDLELGGPVEVAVRKAPPVELVHVRTFSKLAAEKTLHMFRQIQDRNIVAALDAFTTDDGLYVVLEYMHVSLEQIVRSPPYPDERQLAAILGQVSSFIHARASTDHNRS
jgi:hypothetical protein